MYYGFIVVHMVSSLAPGAIGNSMIFEELNGANEGNWTSDHDTDFDDPDGKSRGMEPTALMLVMVGVCLGLTMCVILPIIFPRIRWRIRQLWGYVEPTTAPPNLDKATKRKLRYSTIEAWLVNKKVLDHDHVCQQLVDSDNNKNQSLTEGQGEDSLREACSSSEACAVSDGGADLECGNSFESSNECPICMDEIQVGSIVSWSANPSCNHVFHHECIKEVSIFFRWFSQPL